MRLIGLAVILNVGLLGRHSRHPSAFVRKMRLVPGGLHGMVPRTRYPWRS